MRVKEVIVCILKHCEIANFSGSATLLGQFHLVTLPPPVGTTTVDGIDTSHISVEIMQENISLLESIAAADDATLHNVGT